MSSHSDYWKECIGQAADECELKLTTEAHALLCDLGHAEHITTAKLGAALVREQTKEAA